MNGKTVRDDRAQALVESLISDGLSEHEIAQAVGVSVRSIQRWRAGGTSPQTEGQRRALRRLADSRGV